jgi:23S rRNA (cytidine1920-2'-O)/16S rRNA (cytidine1409-2'-O)-methyltransferase
MDSSFVRLDKLLVDRGLSATRQQAQALILAAKVLVDGQRVTKAGQRVPADSHLEVLGKVHPYVSRGGLKLEHALKTFGVEVRGLVAMDVGASTGGFTDCLLQYGAKRVYAVDVGYGQLAWKLRQDPRVVVLERRNIRHLPQDLIPVPIHIATIDTSFISLKLVIPEVLAFFDLAPPSSHADNLGRDAPNQDSALRARDHFISNTKLIALIKPQFEAGRGHVGKGGVVRDQKIHQAVCDSVAEYCQASGLQVAGIIPSPILGPKGNTEFLLFATYERPCPVV